MRVFISYSSHQRSLAARVSATLGADGHEVYVDSDRLEDAKPVHKQIRELIRRADLMVFLITPRAVRPGAYTLTELEIAQRRWRIPTDRVLPVLAEETPIEEIPGFLVAVPILAPVGDIVAEISHRVDEIARRRRSSRQRSVAVAVALAAVPFAIFFKVLVWPPAPPTPVDSRAVAEWNGPPVQGTLADEAGGAKSPVTRNAIGAARVPVLRGREIVRSPLLQHSGGYRMSEPLRKPERL